MPAKVISINNFREPAGPHASRNQKRHSPAGAADGLATVSENVSCDRVYGTVVRPFRGVNGLRGGIRVFFHNVLEGISNVLLRHELRSRGGAKFLPKTHR